MNKISVNENTNKEIHSLDDNRRRLGIASLHGKIKASMHLLFYADKICSETAASYEDPAKTDAHLYSCIEGIYTALLEIKEHTDVSLVLCSKIVGDKSVPPLDNFTNTMKKENEVL